MIPLTMSCLEEQGWPGTSLAGSGAGRSREKTLPVCHMLIPGNGGAQPLVYPDLGACSAQQAAPPKISLTTLMLWGGKQLKRWHGCNRANSEITPKVGESLKSHRVSHITTASSAKMKCSFLGLALLNCPSSAGCSMPFVLGGWFGVSQEGRGSGNRWSHFGCSLGPGKIRYSTIETSPGIIFESGFLLQAVCPPKNLSKVLRYLSLQSKSQDALARQTWSQ